ncbi:hypothetical protein OCU04_004826 [Sclerotinia nivalis]|uniref:Uncharacterized protein n=1 Tax=Sclerotinia nivalis TaxID=352851 RepID=A0A9X0AR99_9HELO|nr:hypothetical protein OCU04_004826 [Sclerotinia nivalis]
MNFIKRELDSMADIQQPRPFKRQRIVGDQSSVKVVENVPLSPSIIELDRISVFETLNMDAFEEPMEYFALDCAESNSVILLADESGSEIEKQEHARLLDSAHQVSGDPIKLDELPCPGFKSVVSNDDETMYPPPPAQETGRHAGLTMSELSVLKFPRIKPGEEVCFGMVSNIPVTSGDTQYLQTSTMHVRLDQSNQLLRLDTCQVVGKIDGKYSKIFHTLKDMNLASTQSYCTVEIQDEKTQRKIFDYGKKHSTKIFLCVIFYGVIEAFEDVGEFFQECQMYLQDPFHCDRDVKYMNPHMLRSQEEEPVTTASITSESITCLAGNVSSQVDLFAVLRNEDNIEEAETPMAIETPLFRHQKQALKFMSRRESGWAFDSSRSDIWAREGSLYVNTITGETQSAPPPDFRGGLLADEMGLGKTLTMIALIALNQKEPEMNTENFLVTSRRSIKTTLIIAPLGLLEMWHGQLQKHLRPGTMTWYTYYGSVKPSIDVLSGYDIVLTTYETIAAQLKKLHKSNSVEETVYSVTWHRVILDEAHVIRNRGTSKAKSVCALYASNRWAITGTPIQNKLTDLASIIEFLRVFPFSDPETFNIEISQPLQESDQQGLLRLKKLVNSVSLCRPRAVINLPSRTDEIHRLTFTDAEQDLYNSARASTAGMLENAMSEEFTQKGLYLNALRWLNKLRLICNHGVIAGKQESFDDFNTDGDVPNTWDNITAQKAFDSMIDAGAAICVACTVNLADTISGGAPEGNAECLEDGSQPPIHVHLSQCLFILCCSCASKASEFFGKSPCTHHPKCPTFEVSLVDSSHPQILNPGINMSPGSTPTKLKALLQNLQEFKTEKSAIFSYWTFTLDLIECVLNRASIRFTRVDGQLSPDKRADAIRRFQTTNDVRVILISITCGGAGLDLTAASRAYLMEPQWNPQMEEQALCRVYRLGQKKDVTTIRYRILNSFEENVVKIQDRKKDLANLTFSNAKLSETDVEAGRLHYLRAALR